MSVNFEPSIGPGVALLDPDNEETRLGFGCAGLMRLASRRARQRLLGEAFDHGFSHFDVARMYGLGKVEAELGHFARGRRREEVTIATKFGIAAGSPRLASLQAPARMAMTRLPTLRAAIKRRSGGARGPRLYNAAIARESLETSLGELGTDYVDLFFVHDPGPQDQVDLDGLGELCEELEGRGLIRAWGFSGDPNPCISLTRSSTASVLQVRDDIFEPVQPCFDRMPATIGFGVLSSALERIQRHLGLSEARRASWSAAVGQDCGRVEVLASLLLQDALERNRGGGVLFATTRRERIEQAAAAATPPSPDSEEALRAFRSCVLGDLGRPEGGGG